MKTLTYIQIDPDSDSYDIIAVDDMIITYGDDYHDKIWHQFEGIKAYLMCLKEDFVVVRKNFPRLNDVEPSDSSPETESLKKYLKYLHRQGYVEKV